MDYRKPLVANFALKVCIAFGLVAVMVIAVLLYTVINGLLVETRQRSNSTMRARRRGHFNPISEDQLATSACRQRQVGRGRCEHIGHSQHRLDGRNLGRGIDRRFLRHRRVVWTDRDGTMAAFRNGEAVQQAAPKIYLGLRHRRSAGTHRRRSKAPRGSAATLSATAEGYRAIAVAEILRSDGANDCRSRAARYLLMSNAIGEGPACHARGQAAGVARNLTIAAGAGRQTCSAPVINASGKRSGYLVVDQRQSARELARSRYGQMCRPILGIADLRHQHSRQHELERLSRCP